MATGRGPRKGGHGTGDVKIRHLKTEYGLKNVALEFLVLCAYLYVKARTLFVRVLNYTIM